MLFCSRLPSEPSRIELVALGELIFRFSPRGMAFRLWS